uniref:Uncharacterized protein n=1 Tax=Arundo donax TaxID=35708 RepID=A0A0A8YSN4_ARUDO
MAQGINLRCSQQLIAAATGSIVAMVCGRGVFFATVHGSGSRRGGRRAACLPWTVELDSRSI